jgi:hypothetical protein
MSISTVSTGELLLRNVYWDWDKGSLFGIHKVRFAKVELTKDLKGRKRKYSAGIDKNPVYSVAGFDRFNRTLCIPSNDPLTQSQYTFLNSIWK